MKAGCPHPAWGSCHAPREGTRPTGGVAGCQSPVASFPESHRFVETHDAFAISRRICDTRLQMTARSIVVSAVFASGRRICDVRMQIRGPASDPASWPGGFTPGRHALGSCGGRTAQVSGNWLLRTGNSVSKLAVRSGSGILGARERTSHWHHRRFRPVSPRRLLEAEVGFREDPVRGALGRTADR